MPHAIPVIAVCAVIILFALCIAANLAEKENPQ